MKKILAINQFNNPLMKKVIQSVFVSIFLMILFHLFYFNGKIHDNYIVYTSNVDDVRQVNSSESMAITITKPFDDFYIPIATVNIDELEIKIDTDDKTGKKIKILLEENTGNQSDKITDYQKYYNDNFKYYLVEGINETSRNVPKNYKITFYFNSDNAGLLLIGTSRERLAYQTAKDTVLNYWIYAYVLIVCIAGTIVIRIIVEKCNDSIKIYTMIAVFLGGIYFALLPPGCTNDSLAHIMSIYNRVSSAVGHSDWLNINGDSRYSLYQTGDGYIIREVLRDSERKSANPNTKMYDEQFYVSLMRFPNDETMMSGVQTDLYLYPNIVYLPYYLVMLLGRILNINLMLTLHMARMLGFLFYLIMIRFAIKLMPYGKDALAIFALTPMMLQSMVAISYDLFCIGGTFIALAFVLNLYARDFKFVKQDAGIVAFLMITLIPSKSGIYFACSTFVIVLLMLSKKLSRRLKRIVLFGLFFIGLFALIICNRVMLDIQVNDGEYYARTDIITKPDATINLLITSIISCTDRVLSGMFGGRLGWDESILPWFVTIMNMLMFISACMYEEFDIKLPDKAEKITSIITIVIFVLGIFIIFLSCTEITREIIYGVQGRYFIPIIPLLICLLKNNEFKLTCKKGKLYLSSWYISLVNIMFIMTVYLRR